MVKPDKSLYTALRKAFRARAEYVPALQSPFLIRIWSMDYGCTKEQSFAHEAWPSPLSGCVEGKGIC